MTPLLGKTLAELQDITTALGMPKFAAKQIAQWLYVKRVHSIDEMTNLSKENRARLEADGYTIGYEDPVDAARSKDGTIRYLFATPVGKHIETVYLPEHERALHFQSDRMQDALLFLHDRQAGLQWATHFPPDHQPDIRHPRVADPHQSRLHGHG